MTHHYVTKSRLHHIARQLSARDLAALGTLACVRVATARQLEQLHAADISTRQSRRWLASLADRQLLVRLPRVIGGVRAGSAGSVFALGAAGAKLATPNAPRRRSWSVGELFLRHTLSVTASLVELREAERSGRLRLVRFAAEPGTWRSFPAPGGGRLTLKPDACAVVRIGGFEDAWLIEVDRATEAAGALTRKLAVYAAHYRSGLEYDPDTAYPRVLWLVPSEARRTQLETLIRQQPDELQGLAVVALRSQLIERVMEGAA